MGRGACLLPRPKRTHALSAGPLDQSGCSRSVCRYGCRQSLVSRGGSDPRSGSPEGVEGMNLLDRIACKANYAAYVKKIMPPRRSRRGVLIMQFSVLLIITANRPPVNRRLGLTVAANWSIIMFTYRRRSSHAQETHPRSQAAGPSPTGHFASPSRTSHRRTVPDQRVFRCPRPGSGQVRDAAPRPERWAASKPRGCRLRVLAALLLPGAGDFPARRPAGADPAQTRAQASSQAHGRSARLCASATPARRFLASGRLGPTRPAKIRHYHPSEKCRARTGAQSKKTAVNPSLPSAIAHQDFATHYEQLRRDALARTSSGGLGLTLLFRQGLVAWMQGCSCGTSPPTRDPVAPANAFHPLPTDVRSQAAVILAGILLHSRPETTL